MLTRSINKVVGLAFKYEMHTFILGDGRCKCVLQKVDVVLDSPVRLGSCPLPDTIELLPR